MTTDSKQRPSHITVENPVFPYLIDDEHNEATSYITIEHADRYKEGERRLFYIAGGSIEMHERGSATLPQFRVELGHAFARDEETDPVTLANFELKGLQMASTFHHTVTYVGWLTSAQFYPEGFQDERYEEFNPFKGAVRQNSDEDPYANNGYPYQAPRVNLGAELTFPLEVEVTLHYDVKGVKTRLARYMESHRSARLKREAAAAAAEKAEIARREKARIDNEKWLQSEEGKEYTIDRELRNILRKIPAGSNFTDEQLVEFREQAVQYFNTLSPEDAARLRKMDEERIWSLKDDDMGRQAYKEELDFRLS